MAEPRPPDDDRTIAYPHPWGGKPDPSCRLRIWHHERVVLATELETNEGPSITNAAEALCEAIAEELNNDGRITSEYTIVEHYEHRRSAPSFAEVCWEPGRVPTWNPLRPGLGWLYKALRAVS